MSKAHVSQENNLNQVKLENRSKSGKTKVSDLLRNEKFRAGLCITKLIAIRTITILFCLWKILMMICFYQNSLIFLAFIPVLLIAIESVFIIIIRKGKDFKW